MFILSLAKGLSVRLALVWLVAVIGVLSLAGQERPVAMQVDEFGRISCDDYLARIDNFYVQLNNNPTVQGLMIVSGDPKYFRNKIDYELNFEGAIRGRKFDPDRVTIARGKKSDELKIQFWIVPAGANPPEFERTERDLKLPPGTKPFVLHDDLEQICWTPTFAKVYKEILDANPRSRGNVVVFAASKRAYAKGVREAKANLKGISPSRLRFFRSRTGSTDPYAEYWIVPPRKK